MEYYPPPGPLCDLNGTNTSFLWNVSTGANINFTGMPVNVTPSNSTGFSNHSAGSSSKVKEKIVNQPNTALLSVILTFGTFLIAWFLKQLRNSQFFGRTVGFSDLNLINK